jgi:hypothetical protein
LTYFKKHASKKKAMNHRVMNAKRRNQHIDGGEPAPPIYILNKNP